MTEEKYTLEQFEIDFEDASPDKKGELLEKALFTFDINDPKVKLTFIKYKEDLQDLKEQIAIEENDRCVKDIESGKLELYKCIKEYGSYKEGENYYVKVDDMRVSLKENWKFDSKYSKEDTISSISEINKLIDKMEPLVWIYSDNGIGSLKKKSIFDPTKSDFAKYSNTLCAFSDFFEKK